MSRRPFVFINMAMTADGKIATANQAVSCFGSSQDYEHLLELRATADAVMTGAGTLKAQPDITLDPGSARFRRIRKEHGLADAPVRIIVSGRGKIDPKAKLFRSKDGPIIILSTEQIPKTRHRTLVQSGGSVHVCGKTEVDLAAALNWLRTEWDVKRLLCEGGGRLNGSLLAAGLVDEIHLTICPKIFGGLSAPAIADGPLADQLVDAKQFKLKSMIPKDNEVFLVYQAKDTSQQGVFI